MNPDLLILRGQYATLEAENNQRYNEIRALSRSIKMLTLHLENYHPTGPQEAFASSLDESATAIARMRELQQQIARAQAEMDRLKPLTGL